MCRENISLLKGWEEVCVEGKSAGWVVRSWEAWGGPGGPAPVGMGPGSVLWTLVLCLTIIQWLSKEQEIKPSAGAGAALCLLSSHSRLLPAG
jgi:hypothetical protein